MRKIWFYLIIGLLTISGPVLAESREEDFWLAVQKGEYSQAAEIAVELGAGQPEYFYLAGVCYQNCFRYEDFHLFTEKYRKSGNSEKLELLLKEQAKNKVDDPGVQLFLGMVAVLNPDLGLGNPDPFLKRAKKQLKDNAYLYNYLGLNEMNQNKYSGSVKADIETAIKLKRDFPEAYNNLAVIYYRNQKPEKAVEVLLDCLVNCPVNPENTFANLVNLTSKTVILTITPCDAGGRTLLVRAPGFDQNYRTQIKAALKEYPGQLLLLAEYLATHANGIDAKGLLDEVTPDGQPGLYYYVLFHIHKLFGELDQMKAAAAKVIDAADSDYRRLFECGYVLFHSGEFEMAGSIYEASLKKVNPADDLYLLKIYSNLGTSYYMSKDYRKAIAALEKALVYEPNDTISMVNLGLAYRDDGDKAKAKELLEKALGLIQDAERKKQVEKYLAECI